MKIKRLDFSAHSNYAIDFYFDRQIFACRIAGGSRTWEAEEQSLGSKLNCMEVWRIPAALSARTFQFSGGQGH